MPASGRNVPHQLMMRSLQAPLQGRSQVKTSQYQSKQSPKKDHLGHYRLVQPHRQATCVHQHDSRPGCKEAAIAEDCKACRDFATCMVVVLTCHLRQPKVMGNGETQKLLAKLLQKLRNLPAKTRKVHRLPTNPLQIFRPTKSRRRNLKYRQLLGKLNGCATTSSVNCGRVQQTPQKNQSDLTAKATDSRMTQRP